MPEIEPVWRHPTASQLAFELAHPEQVKLTARSERSRAIPFRPCGAAASTAN